VKNNSKMKKSSDNITSLSIGFDELNLAELPIAVLSSTTKGGSARTAKRRERKDTRHRSTLTPARGTVPKKSVERPASFEIHDWVTDPKTKERQQRTWTVVGSSKHGLPIATDDEVVIGLLLITKGKVPHFDTREVPVSRYELCKEIGWVPSGENYARIQEAYNRLKGVNIYTDKFWDARGKQHVKAAFSIIDNYYLYDDAKASRRQRGEQLSFDFSRIVWNEVLLQSFQQGGLKYLDTPLWFSWKKPITKRLHRYLDKQRYWKKEWHVDLFDLAAFLNIPPSQRQHPKDIKKYVDRATVEMVDRKYLLAAFYTRRGRKHEAVFQFATIPPGVGNEPQEKSGGEKQPLAPAPRQAPALELVSHFYTIFHGAAAATPQPKEIQQAKALIAEAGEGKALFVVDFAFKKAPESSYRPNVFGGIISYKSRAFAAYDRESEAAERREREKAADEEQKRQRQETRQHGEELLAQLSSKEHDQLFAKAEHEFLSQPWAQKADPNSKTSKAFIRSAVIQKVLNQP